jgi:hypothetical protein
MQDYLSLGIFLWDCVCLHVAIRNQEIPRTIRGKMDSAPSTNEGTARRG